MSMPMLAGVGLLVVCSSSSAAYMMMGGNGDDAAATTAATTPKTPAVPAPPVDPCAGLVDDSLASSIPAKCLQKIFKDEGCTEQGTVYPADDYNGWWRKSPQGSTPVACNGSNECGAGNYANVKKDINAWATMTDALHVKGCGRAT